MRPARPTAVHHTGDAAELVCSNSLKSTKPDSAAGLLKAELTTLESPLIAAAKRHAVAAGGALAVDRVLFSRDVTRQVEEHPLIAVERREATDIPSLAAGSDAIVLASGPLTSDALSSSLMALTGRDALAFYDAAAPVVMADSIDFGKVFRQSRYEDAGAGGDYLNAPFTREEYDAFIEQLLAAERVIAKDFETRELFQACQPIEEIARAGRDAPRFGTLKPVGLTDPRTGAPPLGGFAAARRGRPRRQLQPRRVPDQPHLPRAAPRVSHDPRPGRGGVRALRRHAPQHLHRRAAAARPS